MRLKNTDVDLLGNVFDQIGKVLVILDKQWIIKYINNYALDIMNTNEHIMGVSCQDILLKSNIPFKLDNNANIIFSAPIKVNNSYKKLKTLTGTVDEKPVYFILDDDVTEQENTLQLLEKSTQELTGQVYREKLSVQQYLGETIGFLRTIIKQMPCYVYWKDDQFRYLYCNDLTVQIMGLSSAEEAKGKTDYDFGWDLSLVNAFRETDIKILNTGEPVRNLRENLIDKNGQLFHTLVNKLPIKNQAGVIIGILGFTVDITEIQNIQIAKEAAEAASIAKTEFIANMSHDIRTPLTGVIGLSEILEQTLQNEEDREKAHMLHGSGEELLHMLNEILDDVRAGNLRDKDVKTVSFDLHQCIQDLIRLESPAVTLKNLELQTNIAPNVPRYIKSDHNKIHRILLNLIGNAIKFTPSGCITLSIECLHCTDDKAHLKFSVSDTGIGIPEDARDQIFNRFFKVSSSYNGVYNGHGLGLHIAQSYVKLLGGHITLTSKEGTGSTFHFNLECALGQELKDTSQYHTPQVLLPDSTKAPHLLLVEDNLIALKSLELLLKQKNYTFSSVTSGEEAWAMWNSLPFDLMVTDVGLPGISGIELTQRIRKHEQQLGKPRLPVIGLTGHARELALQECILSGMDDVLSKPAHADVLHQCIQQLVPQFTSKGQKVVDGGPRKSSLGADLPDTEEELFQLEQFCVFNEELALNQCIDREFLIALLESCLYESMPHDIMQLREAHQQQNWGQVEKIAHKIKGGMAYIGAQKIRFACQYFERYYKAGHRALLEPLYQQIITVSATTNEVLQRWLERNK
jgi:two-component system aerobic respiration control sensor histidine kinase ArcB